MENINYFEEGEQLFRILSSISPLSAALQKRMGEYIILKTFPKKHLLLKEGEIAKQIFFICKGSARAFYHDKDGKEHTTWFMTENDLMISVYSFYRQAPALENIELLEDSVLLCMRYEKLQDIYQEFPEYNLHGRLFTERYYIQSEERAIILRTKKPAERYQLLLDSFPGILQKASLGQIASFLGIALETLSRIRAGRKT
jgi:CRP-like cAMP-binding protein